MSPRWMRALLGLGAVIIVALLGLNLYINLKPTPKAQITQPLSTLLPKEPAGWQAKDEPIANTPEEEAQVEGVLHYDDAVYRIYDNGRANVGVYIAYWKPGEFSPAKVGSHSPDTCWVHNGWDMRERNQGVEHTLANGSFKPMETGTFEKDGQRVYVIFWHLVGGVPMKYDLTGWTNGLAGRIQRIPTLVADFSKFGLDQRKEQLVIRLSSNVPFEDLWPDSGFDKIMDGLGHSFDLYSKPTGADNTASVAAAPVTVASIK